MRSSSEACGLAPWAFGSQSNPHSRGRTTRLVSRVVRVVSQANIHFA